MYAKHTTLDAPADGKLLVDVETGRVLRCDDEVTVTLRYLESHPFIHEHFRTLGTWLAGPDADRHVRGITNDGDFIVLEQISAVGEARTLRKVEEE